MLHQLSEADDGTTLAAKVGDEIVVGLHALPSSGYRWWPQELESDVLESVDRTIDFDEGTVGGRNQTRFLLRVKQSGRARIWLLYDRGWRNEEPALKQWQVTVEAS